MIRRRPVAVMGRRVGEVCSRPLTHSVRIGNSFYIEVSQVTRTLHDNLCFTFWCYLVLTFATQVFVYRQCFAEDALNSAMRVEEVTRKD